MKTDWTRKPGVAGGTCGSRHLHSSGWQVIHCGHPTANFPYYVEDTTGKMHLDQNGRGFRLLERAKGYVDEALSNKR
jgi:hypothetical protein